MYEKAISRGKSLLYLIYETFNACIVHIICDFMVGLLEAMLLFNILFLLVRL